VRLNDQPVEIVPEGVLLLLNNADRPGMVGYIGMLLAKHNVNIATMSLHRDRAGGRALTVLNLDSVPPTKVLQKLQSDPDIDNVRVARLS
jgi:D-3-phosphoglycerate dehydrogenase